MTIVLLMILLTLTAGCWRTDAAELLTMPWGCIGLSLIAALGLVCGLCVAFAAISHQKAKLSATDPLIEDQVTAKLGWRSRDAGQRSFGLVRASYAPSRPYDLGNLFRPLKGGVPGAWVRRFDPDQQTATNPNLERLDFQNSCLPR